MIDILHSAFTHRHYIRSWWYNATQLVTASTILLHVILLDRPQILLETGRVKADLVEDVNKSLQILRSMDQMVVAVRYADLLEDILEITEQSSANHPKSQLEEPEGRSTRNNFMSKYLRTSQEATSFDSGGNGTNSHERTAAPHTQNSVLSRDDVLSSLMNHNQLDNVEAPSDDIMFGGSEGWNVAGNVFSDFAFTGENNDASLWDWDHH
jgi:hypothetical protein